jgi:hypothetical protein
MRIKAVLLTTAILLTLGTNAVYGLDVYHIGNSLTDETYGMHDIAAAKGTENITWGRHMTPGCPLYAIWQDREDKTGYIVHDGEIDWSTQTQNIPYVLANYNWDAVVMQVYPMNGDDVGVTSDAAIGFAGLIYQTNPDCQIFILTSHAGAEDGWELEMSRLSSRYEPIANSVTLAFPNRKPTLVVPVLQAMNSVRAHIAQGDMPGLGTLASFYQADGGHLGPKGLYIAALTMYATLYRSDPDGAVTSGLMYWQYENGYSVTQDFANLAYDIVWNVVTAYPMAGVNTTQSSVPFVAVRRDKAVGAMNHDMAYMSLLGRAMPRGAAMGAVGPFIVSRGDGNTVRLQTLPSR